MSEIEVGGSRETKIDEFLAFFDGDIEKATAALRERREQTVRAKRAYKPPSTPVIVSVQDLAKQYKVGRQKIEALKGVSLDIHEGEFVALTGSSGSGKSTLLQMMGGLDKPTSGKVIINGTNLTAMSDSKLSTFRGQTIGFVFQFFYLQPFLRLGRNLEVPGMFARSKSVERKQRIAELAEAVGLSDRISHLPKELSGGQMQRAAIARALFNNPKVILADEPTGNLDSKNGQAIIELFLKIRKEFGTTVVIVTHDASVAERADREISLKDGMII